jgi:hypothetical protein
MTTLAQTLLSLLVLAGLCAFYGWYESEYPCTRSELQCTPAHIDLQHQADGNVSPVYVWEHCQNVCVERSERAR